ncbi:helix-turn-helix domain-containing protein [Streptomyces cavourensis]|uniref:helix-turn-helix domain-containing protein n=1 Tax=Streptomyces cavourensis TaxID=67258 RepID=UPI001C985CFA|nr:XRE family transcriptional regulator [Streptomyces cavourensis]
MPRWKALPDELDPQIREFASRLRRIVEHSGLDVNAVADRTGFSETAWERYLSGQLLPPRRAVVALADVTGTPQHHLTALWEPAERAWSRAGTRQDVATETLRIRQVGGAPGSVEAAGAAPRGATATGTSDHGGPGGHHSGAYADDPYAKAPYANGPYANDPYGSDPRHPDGDGRAPHVPAQRGSGTPDRQQQPSQGARRNSPPGGGSNAVMFGVGAVGALIVITGAVMLAPGDEPAKATPATAATTPAATPSDGGPGGASEEPAAALPDGVECRGDECAGQNPDAMGCGGEHARTVTTTAIGTARVEVRYSEVCSAAWARLTEAGPGDTVTITGSAAAAAQNGRVSVREAYTPMVAVEKAADAKACATLTSGTKGCTT